MPFDPEAVRAFERDGWNRAAAGYENAFATATRQFIEPLLDAAAVGTGTKVLDLCCGPGFVAAAARERGAMASGLDFSAAMLAEARARFPAITFDAGDAEALPYPDASLDAVVANFGIHHVPRPALALSGVHRILRSGGKFAFSIWAGHEENIAWKLVFDAIGGYGDLRASAAPPPGGGFAADDCLRAMAEAGFVHTEARSARGIWRHKDAAALLGALHAGTARMAALIDAQAGAATPEILSALDTAAAPWRAAGPAVQGSPEAAHLAVPIACVIIAGTRT